MLVDDDADDVASFCEALEGGSTSIEFQTAENGIGLFEILLTYRPDVIFLDINMPIMGGWDCLRRLKSSLEYQRIPVIVFSTSSAKRDIDMAYSLGALLFVTKPEDFSELSDILRIVAKGLQDAEINSLKEFKSVKAK